MIKLQSINCVLSSGRTLLCARGLCEYVCEMDETVRSKWCKTLLRHESTLPPLLPQDSVRKGFTWMSTDGQRNKWHRKFQLPE